MKYATENGRLTPEGDELLSKIHDLLRVLYCQVGAIEKCSEQEIETITSNLHKMVGDINLDERVIRQEIAKSFARDRQILFDMSDDQFTNYLKEKYGPEYNIFTPMTKDELDRNSSIIQRQAEEALKKMREDTEALIAINYPFVYPKYPRF